MHTKLNCVFNRYIKIYISQWQEFANSAVWSHSMHIWKAQLTIWNLCQIKLYSSDQILQSWISANQKWKKNRFWWKYKRSVGIFLWVPFCVYFDSKEFSCNPIGKAFLKNSFELMLPDMPLFSTSRRKKKTNSKKTFEK